jgi:hypothetical protein
MTQGRFYVWLSAIFAIMSMTRLSLEPQSADYLLISRSMMINLTVAATILSVLSLVMVRLQEVRMSIAWLIPTFLWLTAAEPGIRILVGGAVPATLYPGPVGNWADIPMMLGAFLMFLGVYEGHAGRNMALTSEKAQKICAWLAAASLIARPHLVLSGLGHLPFIGENMHIPGALLSGSLEFDMTMTSLKGLFIGVDWFGNAVMVTSFAAMLTVLFFSERIHAADLRRSPTVEA